jgi:outer membrane protein OmpA-like peptidoglycan-associated protein
MSINLLESLKEHLSGDVISNLASLVGESQAGTESALQSAISTLLSGLIKQSRDSQSIGKLFNMLVSGSHDGGLLSNLGALSRGGEESGQLLTQGGNLLSSLFGDSFSGAADLIANASGISKNSSSSLLNFVTPVTLGLLGKVLKTENISSPDGLAQLLSGQSGFIKDYLPAGLDGLLATASTGGITEKVMDKIEEAADSFGLDEAKEYVIDKASDVSEKLDNLGDTLESMAEETLSSAKEMAEDFGDSASKFGSHVVEESKEFAHSAAEVVNEAEEKGGKFLPWLLILAALALLWGLLKSCSSQEPTEQVTAPASTPPTAITTPPAEPAATPPPAPAPVAPPTPEPAKVEPKPETSSSSDYEKTLSTGYALKAAKDGFVSKLMTYVESADPISKDLWFTMDGIQFDTNKASIREESAAQIEQIAEVMKAYPKVKIKIGGYTDNTGKAAANKKLSDNRANAVKKAIVAKDIETKRIDAEGYGSDHPVASNDTPDGRQQNRRIDVRVDEK